ncbi:MAG TPA: dephospho-CoA kinase [Longimicrobiales bacterium]
MTGNIASGKSTVARVWERLGARIIDADELARRAVEPGSPALSRIAREFGPGVLEPGGGLDRAALRDLVFRDEGARRRLEAIVHPEVARLRAEEERKLEREGVAIVVNDIPLLFEAGLEDQFDVVVLVDAPEEVRLERLVRDRGLTPDEARRMIEAQMPAEPKRRRADVVIDNAGTLEELEACAERVWRDLLRRASA